MRMHACMPLCEYMCVCVCMPCMCKCPWVPEEGIRFLRTGVAGSCEPPNEGARNRALVLSKNNMLF